MLEGNAAATSKGLVRHYSMSGRMGGTPDNDWILGANYPLFRKMTDIHNPDPSVALLFIDESVQSIDDSFFATQLGTTWMNSPTARHYRGAVFSFADGHAERWKWQGLRTEQDWYAPAAGAALMDLQRMQRAVVGN
jgi:prepilin-type processing-associated H-X9-DG protein